MKSRIRKYATANISREQLAIISILCVAATLRFWALDFGYPGKFRPDEEYLISRALGFHSGDLNPRFFFYGSLYMYVLSAVFWLVRALDTFFGLFSPEGFEHFIRNEALAPLHVIGRHTTALIGVLEVYVLYRLGKTLYGRSEALIAAAALAVNFVQVRESHYATTDIPLSFLSLLSLYAISSIVRFDRMKDYCLAGALIGLSISTKYTACALFVPLGIAYLFCLWRRPETPYYFFGLWRIAAAVSLAALCFFLTSPYFVLDWQTVVEQFEYQKPFIKEGIAAIPSPLGLEWLFSIALRYSLGHWMLITAIFGILLSFKEAFSKRSQDPSGLILVSFVISLSIPYVLSRWVYFRYASLLVPALLLLSSRVILVACRGFFLERRAVLWASAIFLFLNLDPALRAISFDQVLSRKDTRIQAREWIRANLPHGTKIAYRSHFPYTKPPLGRGYRYVGFQSLRKDRSTQWVLIDKHLISYFSPAPPQWLEHLLSNRGKVVAHFSPYSGDGREAVFDQVDAFYVPLAGFSAVTRSGPELMLYRLF